MDCSALCLFNLVFFPSFSFILFPSFCLLCRTAASTFKDFELASAQQRPDMVLRQRFRGLLRSEERTKDVLTKPRTNRFVKLAVMGLTVALGAAALAMVKSALEWAPKFQLQLFP